MPSEKEVFEQVIGKEQFGRVRGMRLGPTPTEVFKAKYHQVTVAKITPEISMENHETVEERSRLTKLESEVVDIRSNMKKVFSLLLGHMNYTQVGSISGVALDEHSREIGSKGKCIRK
ncbi:unnamed protein product [Citrullus colocynthis]|uniref:Uncharacterized protein n=1 Tax=Citrullus colocynthis TaxID=252529 RepID=A0ABP0XMD6_9ROSI